MNSPITSTSAFEVAKEDFSESLNSALSDFQKEFERVLSNESNSVSGATTGNSSVYFNEDGTSTFVSHPISEQVSAESTPIDLGNQFISPIFVGEDGTISQLLSILATVSLIQSTVAKTARLAMITRQIISLELPKLSTSLTTQSTVVKTVRLVIRIQRAISQLLSILATVSLIQSTLVKMAQSATKILLIKSLQLSILVTGSLTRSLSMTMAKLVTTNRNLLIGVTA